MTQDEARALLLRAWPRMVEEFRSVLGSELHYQAVAYHCLRLAGAPRMQIGMNVKQMVSNPVSTLFQQLDARKHQDFRGGFEPIPDIVLFGPGIAGDWRRRNRANTLRQMVMAIEVKASEREAGRLRRGEITRDIAKLNAHREEIRHLGGDMVPVMLVVDTAPLPAERMSIGERAHCAAVAHAAGVMWLHVSQDTAEPLVET